MTDEMIGVTGATGQLGRRVVRQLAAAGVPQRLLVRDPARAPQVERAEVVVAPYQDPEAITAALRGIRTVFLVSAAEGRHRSDLHDAAVASIAAAGVQRVVYTSFMGAAPRATFPYARDHAHTEAAIVSAGLQLTALRNSFYADYAPRFVGDDGVIRAPAGRGRVAWVAREDVARLAATVLLDPVHAGQVYDVSGPEAIDFHQTAAGLAEVTGVPISYREETEAQARESRAGPGVEDWMIDGWVGSYLATTTGETSVTSHTVEHVTGVAPMTLVQFLRAEPQSWRHLLRS